MRRIILLSLTMLMAMFGKAQNSAYYNRYKTWSAQLERAGMEGNSSMEMVCLGSCYDRGAGVTQDRDKAFSLFQKAAKLGDTLGKYNVALYLYRGYCGSKDYAEAERIFKEVIDKSPTLGAAYNYLAQIYEEGGHGIESDDVKAFNVWERMSKVSGWEEWGEKKMASAYKDGKGVPKDIEKAKSMILPYASNGDDISMIILESCYQEEKNYKEAFKWLEKLHDKGVKFACHNLGDLYYYGNGVEQSYQKAYELFSEGAANNRNCKYRQADMLRKGTGVEKDEQQASRLMLESADDGYGQACYVVASDYYKGDYRENNFEEAVKYFNKALESSRYLPEPVRADIYKKLSSCYRFGAGVEADEAKADELMEMSAQCGDADAAKIQEWLTKTKD